MTNNRPLTHIIFFGEIKVNIEKIIQGITEKDKTRIGATPNCKFDIGIIRQISVILDIYNSTKCKLFVRFDDANPKIVSEKDYSRWRVLLKWLNIRDLEFVYQHERLKRYYEYAEKLIRNNLAYVCFCSNGDIKKQKKFNFYCECRNRNINENLDLWKKMIEGEYEEGECVLRIKTKEKTKNPILKDWILVRIIDIRHPRLLSERCAWPLYDFSSTIDDHELGVTFVVKSIEHKVSDIRQERLAQYLKLKNPRFIYIGKLNSSLFKYDILKYLGHLNFSKIPEDLKNILSDIPITENKIIPIKLIKESRNKLYENHWIENVFSDYISGNLNNIEKIANIGFYLFKIALEFEREGNIISNITSTGNNTISSKGIDDLSSRYFLLSSRYFERSSIIFNCLYEVANKDEKNIYNFLKQYSGYWFKTYEALSSYSLGNYFNEKSELINALSEYKKSKKFWNEANKILNKIEGCNLLKKENEARILIYTAAEKSINYKKTEKQEDVNSKTNSLNEIIDLRKDAAKLYNDAGRRDLFCLNRCRAIEEEMEKLKINGKDINDKILDEYKYFYGMYLIEININHSLVDPDKIEEYKKSAINYLIDPSIRREYNKVQNGFSEITGLKKKRINKFLFIVICGLLIMLLFKFFSSYSFSDILVMYLISIAWPLVNFFKDFEVYPFTNILNSIKKFIRRTFYLLLRRISKKPKYE